MDGMHVFKAKENVLRGIHGFVPYCKTFFECKHSLYFLITPLYVAVSQAQHSCPTSTPPLTYQRLPVLFVVTLLTGALQCQTSGLGFLCHRQHPSGAVDLSGLCSGKSTPGKRVGTPQALLRQAEEASPVQAVMAAPHPTADPDTVLDGPAGSSSSPLVQMCDSCAPGVPVLGSGLFLSQSAPGAPDW